MALPTYQEYKDFCKTISKTGVPQYTVEKACRYIDALSKPFVIIKHDVEDKPEKALAISKIEYSFGITSTYYVHSFFLRNPKNVAIFNEIMNLGHEIGYHFDVLDNNNGDLEKATQEFREALSRFSENGFTIKTVCPHGNPFKSRVGYSSNKDFFLDPKIRNTFKDVVDVYITFPDMLDKDYLYITDAKYAYFYRDAKTTKTDATENYFPLKSKDEIIKLILAGHSLIISTHTHRYFRFVAISLIKFALYKFAKQAGGILSKVKWGRYILNKFYFMAKRV